MYNNQFSIFLVIFALDVVVEGLRSLHYRSSLRRLNLLNVTRSNALEMIAQIIWIIELLFLRLYGCCLIWTFLVLNRFSFLSFLVLLIRAIFIIIVVLKLVQFLALGCVLGCLSIAHCCFSDQNLLFRIAYIFICADFFHLFLDSFRKTLCDRFVWHCLRLHRFTLRCFWHVLLNNWLGLLILGISVLFLPD